MNYNEIMLKSDNSDSFSSKSDNSHKKEDIDFETEEEKKNRLSLQKALESNNSVHAFEKINKNISSFCSNIQILQEYSLYLGSKQDNKEKGSDIDKRIIETADKIAETFDLIEIIKNFEYSDRDQKINNITKANRLEDECNKYKKIFDDLTDKIKKQNINLIRQARNSVRYSNFSDFSSDMHLNDDQYGNNSIGFQNGKEFLDGIEMKKKQNDAIYKATKKIERSLSRKNTMTMNIKVNDANVEDKYMEVFNIEYNNKKNELQNNLLNNTNYTNYEKNSGEENKYTYVHTDSSIRSSKVFRDMEDKVFIALEGQRQNFFRRHWIISLIIIILIIAILYYLFYFKKK